MKKNNLLKVLGFSLLFSAIGVNGAFAETKEVAPDETVSYEVEAIDPMLIEKQEAIDLFMFKENNGYFADLDFTVTHTAVVGAVVEVGITPFTQEAADFIYEKFGSDQVAVVDTVSPEMMYIALETTAVTEEPIATSEEVATTSEEVKSLPETGSDSDVIYYTTTVDTGEEATTNLDDVMTTTTEEYDPIIAETTIGTTSDDAVTQEENNLVLPLAIAGAAVLLVGGLVVNNRRKLVKN